MTAQMLSAQNEQDTVRFTLWGKRFIILPESGADVKVEKVDSLDFLFGWDDEDDEPRRKHNYESGSWGGISLGMNGYRSSDGSMNLPASERMWELDYSKSIGINFEIADIRLSLSRDKVGITSGLGFGYHNYAFKNNPSFTVTADSVTAQADTVNNYDKNKLRSLYIQIPLILDFNSQENKGFHLGVGVIGGARLTSRLKQKYENSGDQIKNKTRGHYHMNPFSLDLTARVGYGDVLLYANYGLLTVFEKDKGPELYPFEIGLLFNF